MLDIMFTAVIVTFFIVTQLYARWCKKL